MSYKDRIELLTFLDWMRWGGSGEKTGAMRWMVENQDDWVLLWMGFRYGDEKALEQCGMYLNLDAPDKKRYFDHALNSYYKIIERAGQILERKIAKKKRDQRESGGNGQNSEILGDGL